MLELIFLPFPAFSRQLFNQPTKRTKQLLVAYKTHARHLVIIYYIMFQHSTPRAPWLMLFHHVRFDWKSYYFLQSTYYLCRFSFTSVMGDMMFY